MAASDAIIIREHVRYGIGWAGWHPVVTRIRSWSCADDRLETWRVQSALCDVGLKSAPVVRIEFKDGTMEAADADD